LWFNRETEREREKEESDAQGSSESHICMGRRRRRKGTALLVFSNATAARPSGSSMKVKIHERRIIRRS